MAKQTTYTFHETVLPPDLQTGPLASVSPLVLQILYKRGFQTSEAMSDMLFGHLDWSLQHVSMRDTEPAVALLAQLVQERKRIVVYQDYDVDGCAAGALCLETLRTLGGVVDSYVNDRELDGYGICSHGIDNILQQYPDVALLLTVDNGIVAHEAIAYAYSKGVPVLVTDHHAPGDTLPEAAAVIDPKRTDETYPFHELCGTAVAFKLMLALYRHLGENTTPVLNTIDLVALATVADVVPLVGENRDFVREGLRCINAQPRPAFRVMRELFRVREVTAHYTIGFQYAPTINALSRMGADPQLATQVLLSHDEAYLRQHIAAMMQINEERKAETSREEQLARSMVDTKHLPNMIILQDDSFQEGIVGIVAGKLKNEYNRPVMIGAPNGQGFVKASCRSIEGFHMKENLDQVADLLTAYGGHAKAAGLTVRAELFETLQARLLAQADAALSPESFLVKRELDAVLDMSQATVGLIRELHLLEPFGEGHPAPLFGLRYDYDSVQFFGENHKHVKYWNREHNLTIIEWSGAADEQRRQSQHKRRRKAIGTLELNEYNGRVSPQFRIINS